MRRASFGTAQAATIGMPSTVIMAGVMHNAGQLLIFGERHLRSVPADYDPQQRATTPPQRTPPPTPPPASPGNEPNADPFSAVSSTNTSEARRSPGQERGLVLAPRRTA
jgi:hypothetical protein